MDETRSEAPFAQGRALVNLLSQAAQDVRSVVEEIGDAGLRRLDLVTREEFEVQRELLAQAREQLARIQRRLDDLDRRLTD